MADMTFENVTDERTARAVIASVTETGDFQTNTVLRLAGNGLDTLRLALSNELIVGMQRDELHSLTFAVIVMTLIGLSESGSS